MASDSPTPSENIQLMKLMHEMKAQFPKVSDETVKQCVLKHGLDRESCMKELKAESDTMGPLHRSLEVLLSHQMEQRLKLENMVQMEREHLSALQEDVKELALAWNRKDMLKQNNQSKAKSKPIKAVKKQSDSSPVANVVQANEQLQKEVEQLRKSCERMANEVTQRTGGKVPLGETSIEFYESLTSGSLQNASVPNLNLAPEPTTLPPASQGDGPQWSCSQCTFLNHPALNKCEECEMPKIEPPVSSSSGL